MHRNDNAELYRSLYRIRRVEEEIARMYPSDKIKSPVHLSIGQEAVAVAVCSALGPEDVIFCSYRSHAAYLAKGGDLNAMVAELYGKVTGCCKGKGGSMHLVDRSHGVMGASAVVGTTIANAVGYAYAVKLQRKSVVVVSFFGDGATDEGVFYESLNFAALKKLPIVFVCENNSYAIHTHQSQRQARVDLTGRAESLGVPADRVEDDVFEVLERVSSAVERIRAGDSGPVLFECLCYRWKEHVGPNEDFHLGYRAREDAERWMAKDQVRRVAGMLAAAERDAIERQVEEEVGAAFLFAEQSPFPETAELYRDVY
jgi:TPP-dependent pyruvate/acetoin dehydrogenase alpha subunit